MEKIIDCKGLKCPQPVINTKKFFNSISEGSAEVIVDNEIAKSMQCCSVTTDMPKKFTIVISSDKLGSGDDTLGTILMKSYIYALSESDTPPTDLIFLNGGIHLTVEGSLCLDSLKALQNKGTNILSCGTCLDFYGLKEKLLIGEISNMYTIVEKMNSADSTIKI